MNNKGDIKQKRIIDLTDEELLDYYEELQEIQKKASYVLDMPTDTFEQRLERAVEEVKPPSLCAVTFYLCFVRREMNKRGLL